MKRFQRNGLMAISSAALVLGLAACDRADERTAAERTEAAPTRTEQAVNETRRDTREATASADASMDRAAQNTREMGASAADTTRDLGAAAADKTRQMGSSAASAVDDATITTKVNAALAADKDLSALRIDVDTQNGIVTLSGPAPTASAKERASDLARKVEGVSSVNNQLTLSTG
jgi:osmotically-inducible protein OsmY